ncbi:tyrosine-type recombinase/integrase [Lactococcus lactis]|uniref:Integrase n=1 Tax=Lactococcus lactis TaxID=1358 RepID=A0AAW5TJZ8_9LACT|nr:site-specific integrase [Lactococcus lactis]MCW2281485.1 integrase [Lactococcus lactis]
MRKQKLKEIKKADGSIILVGQVYLGIDSVTKKRRNTTIRAKNRRQWDNKARQAKLDFKERGNTTYIDPFKFETFEELTNDWIRVYSPTLKSNTRLATLNYIKNYLSPSLKNYSLDEITPRLIGSIVKKWAVNADTAIIKNGRRENGKGKDYSYALHILKKIFEYGFEVGAIESNPAMSICAPKPQKRINNKKIKYFSNNELEIWLQYLKNLSKTPENIYDINLYMLLLETGLRIGEALALTWNNIDFENQKIHIEATITKTGEIQHMPKSEESIRDIYINANTIERLQNWKLHQIKILNTLSINNKGFVFPGIKSLHANYETTRVRFIKHLKKSNLPNIGLHGFRHTHATLLLNSGADYKEIQNRLGHASISTTMDTYSHLSNEKARETANLVNFSLKKIQ